MKKLFIFACISILSTVLLADSALLKDYKKNDFVAVCSENFNSGANNWKLGNAFSVDNKDGILGTAALHGVCKNAKGIIPSPSLNIKITPGATYKVTLQYKVRSVPI